MNRVVAVSLAAVVIATGLVIGQTGRAGTPAEEPTPPSSVIRVGPTDRPAFGTKPPQASESDDPDVKPVPKKRKPPPLIIHNGPKDPTPPPSVIKKEIPKADPEKKPEPRKLPPMPPKSETIRRSSYQQTVPAVPVPPTPEPPLIPLRDKPVEAVPIPPTPVAEQIQPLPAVTGEVVNGHGRYPSYATNLITPFPWTKCGRRVCGALYVDTPYIWLDASYLWGWMKQDHTQTLVTTGAPNSENRGALGDPGTTVLYDGQAIMDQPFHGGKFNAGFWLDECQYCGLEGGYFFFASQDKGFIAADNGFPGLPGLYIPYFNPLTGQEAAFPVADPGAASGIVNINYRARLQGADAHMLLSFARNMTFRMDALIGYRWLALDGDLTIEENVRQGRQVLIDGTVIPNSDVGISDRFSTRSSFYGCDLGFKTHWERACWSCDLLTRVAIGGNHNLIRGDGFTGLTLPFPGVPTLTTPLGRYIGPANSVICGKDTFSVVPEVGISFAYMPRNWVKFTMGFNWAYWTDVVRPGGQVDRVINPIGVPTQPEFKSDIYEPRRPGVPFNETDIWFQSVTLGMQFMY